MNRDVVIVLVTAVVATFNPSLLMAVTVMLLLPHPKRLMAGYLLGAYTSSVAAGLAIIFSLHGSSAVGASTHLLSPGGEIAVGLCAVSFALVMATGHDTKSGVGARGASRPASQRSRPRTRGRRGCSGRAQPLSPSPSVPR